MRSPSSTTRPSPADRARDVRGHIDGSVDEEHPLQSRGPCDERPPLRKGAMKRTGTTHEGARSPGAPAEPVGRPAAENPPGAGDRYSANRRAASPIDCRALSRPARTCEVRGPSSEHDDAVKDRERSGIRPKHQKPRSRGVHCNRRDARRKKSTPRGRERQERRPSMPKRCAKVSKHTPELKPRFPPVCHRHRGRALAPAVIRARGGCMRRPRQPATDENRPRPSGMSKPNPAEHETATRDRGNQRARPTVLKVSNQLGPDAAS